MATRGQVKLKTIFKMLKKCAPDHQKELKEHHWWVSRKGTITYKSLPKGSRRNDLNVDVEIGHVVNLVKKLRIDPDCAMKQIKALQSHRESLLRQAKNSTDQH